MKLVTPLLPRIALVAIASFIVWALWRQSFPKPLFEVVIDRGEPKVLRGVVTPAFLQMLREVRARHELQAGKIRGVPRGTRISLRFSRDIPPGAQQQVKNWWALSGWTAGKLRNA